METKKIFEIGQQVYFIEVINRNNSLYYSVRKTKIWKIVQMSNRKGNVSFYYNDFPEDNVFLTWEETVKKLKQIWRV